MSYARRDRRMDGRFRKKGICTLFDSYRYASAGGGVSDPLWSYVVMRMPMDGPGTSTFTDICGHTFSVVPSGTADINTGLSQFGGKSLRVGSARGGGIYTPGPVAEQVGLGDCCIEIWVYLTTGATSSTIFGHQDGAGGSGRWFVGTNNGDATKLSFYFNGSIIVDSATGILTTGSWHHIAWDRLSGVSLLFVGGVQVASFSDTGNDYTSTKDFAIGSGSSGATAMADANLDDFRYTLHSRYRTTFTPPTVAFPVS